MISEKTKSLKSQCAISDRCKGWELQLLERPLIFLVFFFFSKAAAEVASTPVPTHPPTPQKDRWRVEEERLKYREGEEGNEGSGCGR